MKIETPAKESRAIQSVATENTEPTQPAHAPAAMRLRYSPRGNVVYSFLLALEWCRSKLRSLFGRKAPSGWQGSDPAFRDGKFRQNQRVTVLLCLLLLTSLGGLAVAHNRNQFVPRYQEFSDPVGRFANFNVGGPTVRMAVAASRATRRATHGRLRPHTFETASMPRMERIRFSGALMAPAVQHKMFQPKGRAAPPTACF